MNPTPQQHLQTVVDNWEHLADMLDTHVAAPWPPAGRMSDYLAALDYADAQHAPRPHSSRELEVPAGQPPLNLAALDAIRTTELALLGTADHIAAQVQRYPVTVDSGRGWTDDVHRQVALLAVRDQADPRRWSLTDTTTRTPCHAAVWLQQRLDNVPGPFRPLTVQQHDRIADVARESATRVQAALATLRRRTEVPYPCPHCRARALTVQGGDGRPPAAECGRCGRTWTPGAAAVA
ncbi:hypothetical protein [Streptomyces sp. MMS20-AI2-20]|uniref:hypothetical protein n=1 Tax=Streptomyces sp. MMS20-AI2-20 TaxID=2925835 RepID=UPI001F609119|nr:hypothetical protein [Streptomyces sp. MMS20-AI2-20]MCI4143035.1 hypothetical protein [Streptomyces sp. MMS20-AI2-20]